LALPLVVNIIRNKKQESSDSGGLRPELHSLSSFLILSFIILVAHPTPLSLSFIITNQSIAVEGIRLGNVCRRKDGYKERKDKEGKDVYERKRKA